MASNATDVICISRTLAAGGEVIGRTVADRLGFRYADEEIVTRAAEMENLDPAVIADAEKRKSLVSRLIDAFGSSPSLDVAALGGMPIDPSLYLPPLERETAARRGQLPERARDLIRAAIIDTANQGRVVIVAHAAGMTLAGTPGLLRVLITASPEVRARRLAAGRSLDEHEADKRIRDSDRDRRDYFKRFQGVGDESPHHYDLVLSTDVLAPERAAQIIIAAVGAAPDR